MIFFEPSPKVKGGNRECQAASAKEWQGGANPRPRAGAAAERSYPISEVRGSGREEQPHIQGAVAVQAQEG